MAVYLRSAVLVLAASALLEADRALAAPATFKVGSFIKATTVTTQTFNHLIGWQPKAVIMWTVRKTSETPSTGVAWSIGFYDGTANNLGIGFGATLIAGPSIETRRRMGRFMIQLVDGTITGGNPGVDSAVAKATLTTSLTQFSLNWTINDGIAGVVHWLAIGGDRVQAKNVEWSTGIANDTIRAVAVDFGAVDKPNVCLNLWTGPSQLADDDNITEDNASMGLGVMDLGERQWAVAQFTDDKDTLTSVAYHQAVADASFLMIGISTGQIIRRGAFNSGSATSGMTSTGFTLDISDTEVNDHNVYSLCLRNLQAYAGFFDKSTTAATEGGTHALQSRTIVAPPTFTPQAILFAGVQDEFDTTPEVTPIPSEARFMLGASDGTIQGVSTSFDSHNVAPASYVSWASDLTTRAIAKQITTNTTFQAKAELDLFTANGFNLEWTTNDTVAGRIFYLALASPSSNALELESFTATAGPEGRSFRWQTGYEVDNLGFFIHEERGGTKHRLTPELIAGSALTIGGGQMLGAGQSYAWSAPAEPADRPGSGPVRYWLETIDLAGKSRQHGPFTATTVAGRQVSVASPLLATFGREGPAAGGPPGPRTPFSAVTDPTRRPLGPAPADAWQLASKTAFKLRVRAEALYRVSGKQLIEAGLDPTVDPRRLQLHTEGRPIPLIVSGEQDGRLDQVDFLEFHGLGADTTDSDERVYWLVPGDRVGLRGPPIASGPPRPLVAGSFPFALEKRERTLYFAALRNGEADNFFGPVVSTVPIDRPLDLHHLASTGGPAELRVRLQGVSESGHAVEVQLNGQRLGVMTWPGRERREATFDLPTGILVEGNNTLRLAASSPVDVTVIDGYRLTYPHALVPDDDAQKVVVPAGRGIELVGFTGEAVRAFDVTSPGSWRELAVTTRDLGGGAGLAGRTSAAEGVGARTLLLVGDRRVDHTLVPERDRPSAWRGRQAGADMLIIGHASLLLAAEPLRALRERQGLKVALIDVEDLYDEFNFGHKSPLAIREFLRHARHHYARPPRFVLLLGDASVDPRNHLGASADDLVPTKVVDTYPLETASDDWFVDFSGSGYPDLAIGRIPARTFPEARLILGKLVTHEQSPSEAQRQVLLIADEGVEDSDFAGSVRESKAAIPPGLTVDLRLPGVPSLAPGIGPVSLLDALNAGPLVVGYFGHGSVGLWRGLFTSAQAAALTNRDRPSLFVAMTCFNGLFHDPRSTSMAEALLSAPQGGAFAVWASSGFTSLDGQRQLNQEFLRGFLGEGLSLGEAARQAKALVGDPDVRRTWVLFGDPSRTLTARSEQMPAGMDNAAAGCSSPGAVAGSSAASLGVVTLMLRLMLRRRRRR